MKATLVQENLSHFCPVTNFYATSDGKHLLVTYPGSTCWAPWPGCPV